MRMAGILAAIALLPAGVTACGGGGDSAEGGSAEGTTLTVWVSRKHYVPADQFKSFMADHPGVTVKFDVKDTDDIMEQLLRMRDAGQPLPDVIHDEGILIPVYYQAGLIQPLNSIKDEWEKNDPESYNKLLPSVWTTTEKDGNFLGFNIAANFDIFWYNIPWFKEAGVQLPLTSLEDVYQASVKLKQVHPDRYPMSVQALAGEGVTGLKTLLLAVGTPFNGATPDLTSEGGQYVIKWYQRMVAEGMISPDVVTWGEAEARGAFMSQNAAFIQDGLNSGEDYGTVDGFKYGEQFGSTLIPKDSGTGLKGVAVSPSRTFAVTSDSKNLELDGQLLQYLAEPVNLMSTIEQGSLPTRQTDTLRDPLMQKLYPWFTPEIEKAWEDAQAIPSADNSGEVEAVLEQMFGEIVTGKGGDSVALADKYQEQLNGL
jgi:multiple sugar transport system substrate-binding protein